MKELALTNYQDFVEGVTSPASNNSYDFAKRIAALDEQVNVPLLLTAGLGMASEGGEFADVVKKVLFHGKELTPEVKEHLSKELGDVIWYWTNACRALDLDPYAVIEQNVAKLSARYPGGKFDIYRSENRKGSDV